MSKKGFHILVIDDNEDILFIINAMLTHNGFMVTTLDNVNNIEQVIRDLKPHLILMDMHLSGADGCDICRELKAQEEFKHLPILMISADPVARSRCTDAGADHFIEKPFEMHELLILTNNYYENHKPDFI